MSSLIVRYKLSEEARKQEFAKTGTLPDTIILEQFTLDNATPEIRKEIIDFTGTKLEVEIVSLKDIAYPNSCTFGNSSLHIDRISSLEEIISHIRRMKDEQKEARIKKVGENYDKCVSILENAISSQDLNASGFYTNDFEQNEIKEVLGEEKLNHYLSIRADFKKIESEVRNEILEARKLKEQLETAMREKKAKEKHEWIIQHGSERLKRSEEGEYANNTAYAKERLESELGTGWILDIKDDFSWDRKVYPSLEALSLEKELREKGYDAIIIWLKGVGKNSDLEFNEECEAILIQNLCGYDAVKIM